MTDNTPSSQKAPRQSYRKNKFLHDVKGPATLEPAVIEDILLSRTAKAARVTLAKKYGISESRVGKIWQEYYGGQTLADYKSGLKKPLPKEAIKTAECNARHFKSERAKYTAKEPKIIVEPLETKANPRRRPAVMKKKPQDLDLDDTDAMTDNEAEILAGEVNAGNNSQELLAAIERLIAHNENISDRAISSLESALKHVSKARRNDYSSTDYSDDNIDTDDSTIAYKQAPPPRQRAVRYNPRDATVDEEVLESSEDGPELVNQRQPAASSYSKPPQSVARPHQVGEELRQRPAGPRARAEPIYRAERRRPDDHEEQGYSCEIAGYEQEVPPAEHYQGQRRVQQSYGSYNPQLNQESHQSHGLHSGSRVGPSDTVPGVPWLKKRL